MEQAKQRWVSKTTVPGLSTNQKPNEEAYATTQSESHNYFNNKFPETVLHSLSQSIIIMASTTLLDSLTAASLLPSKIIPQNFNPTYNLNVAFPSKSPANGSLVRVSEVKETPKVTFSAISDSASAQSFTFFLIDPDAPTPDDPKFAYWRHWVITNIPSSASSISEGKTLTQYLAPGPKDESGPHRYLFLLFKEPQGFSIEKQDVGGEEFVDRRSFGAKEFVEKWGLDLVGVQWMKGVGDGWNGGKDEL
ncbi:hypothetical protein N0V94_002442 [Neodidymelliopsis sp. IMI 364377]|nr:hypothetical protein N0V94_002442 [Neodidymelliopsis sp. IMI 364377]